MALDLSQKQLGGFISSFELKRSGRVMTSIRSGHDVSDSFSSDDWQLRRKEIFFLTNSSGPKSIYAATLVERMHGTGGTGKPKYRLTEPVSFSKTVPLQWIFARLPQLKDFISSPAEGKRIEHGDWLSLVQLVKVYSPDQASALDALLQLFERDVTCSPI